MTLTETRTHLPRSVNDWIDGVLVGHSTVELAGLAGVSIGTMENRARMYAEWAGLPPTRRGYSIREAVLRARIDELEGR